VAISPNARLGDKKEGIICPMIFPLCGGIATIAGESLHRFHAAPQQFSVAADQILP
jgi:hypothetical protein